MSDYVWLGVLWVLYVDFLVLQGAWVSPAVMVTLFSSAALMLV